MNIFIYIHQYTQEIPESIISTLPPGDHNICVEEIHILIRTPIYNKSNQDKGGVEGGVADMISMDLLAPSPTNKSTSNNSR